jgi:hypothetical protein
MWTHDDISEETPGEKNFLIGKEGAEFRSLNSNWGLQEKWEN